MPRPGIRRSTTDGIALLIMLCDETSDACDDIILAIQCCIPLTDVIKLMRRLMRNVSILWSDFS